MHRPKRSYSRCVCTGGSSSQRLAPATFTDHENERSTSACSGVQLPWSTGNNVQASVGLEDDTLRQHRVRRLVAR